MSCLPEETISAIKDAIVGAVPTVQRIWLFGSQARGDASAHSDIDLFFTYDDDAQS